MVDLENLMLMLYKPFPYCRLICGQETSKLKHQSYNEVYVLNKKDPVQSPLSTL